ncbi:MAG TPA: hypothetical protein DHU79_08240 [Clostridiales bacterium]|nr:hypothetical protein [Clostridiales bacterium]
MLRQIDGFCRHKGNKNCISICQADFCATENN